MRRIDGRSKLPAGITGEKNESNSSVDAGATEYGKEFKKELSGSAVVPVVAGKVEMWRITAWGLGLRMGRVLENATVELRASGKTGI